MRSLMRQQALKPVWKRKFIHTTDSKHDLPMAANVLNRQCTKHASQAGLRCVDDGHPTALAGSWIDRPFRPGQSLYQDLLASHGFVCSMSRKGNCWDNAVAERFFLNLKMERVWQRQYANHTEAKADITDYIVGFYNSKRINSALGNLPPSVDEQKMAEREPIVVSKIT